MRNKLRDSSQNQGLAPEKVDAVLVAGSEVLFNEVKQQSGSVYRIGVTLKFKDSRLAVAVYHSDASSSPSPDAWRQHAACLDDLPLEAEPGRGLGIVLKLFPDVAYVCKDANEGLERYRFPIAA